MSQATLHHHARPIRASHPRARRRRRRSRRSSSRCCPRSSTRRSWPPRCPSIAGDLGQPHRRVVGRHRLRRRRGRDHAAVGQARRPPRAQAACSRSRCSSSSLASALCGAAQDITQLIVLRAVQGAAAGGLMTLAMAAVGDLVAPRERGRYQGYIAATFAVATIVGPLIGGVLVDHASWRWVFLVNLPIGAAALAGLHLRLPAPDAAGADRPLDVSGAALLAGATTALMLTCIWGGSRYAWDSAPILALIAATVVLSGALLVARAPRRRPDRPLPPAAHAGRWPSPAPRCSSATAALFSVTVFVPLFLRDDDRGDARPRPGCCWCRPCSASPSRRRCPGARSCARGATSASRSPGWRS